MRDNRKLDGIEQILETSRGGAQQCGKTSVHESLVLRSMVKRDYQAVSNHRGQMCLDNIGHPISAEKGKLHGDERVYDAEEKRRIRKKEEEKVVLW